jgi:hypothetical protein
LRRGAMRKRRGKKSSKRNSDVSIDFDGRTVVSWHFLFMGRFLPPGIS